MEKETNEFPKGSIQKETKPNNKRKVVFWSLLASGVGVIIIVALLLIFLLPKEEKYDIELGSNVSIEGEVLSGDGSYKKGDSVTIVAEEITGYRFTGWNFNGKIISTDKEYTFIIGEDTEGEYTANYAKLYSISVEDAQNLVTITGNKTEAVESESIEFTITPNSDYRIIEVKVNNDTLTESDGKYTFNMPAENVTISVTYAEEYAITIDSSVSDMVTSVSLDKAISGEQIVVIANIQDTITDEQITTQEIKITDMEGGEVPYTVSNLEDSTQYSFTMPASNVTISVESQTLNIIKDYEIMGNIITSYTGPAKEVTVPSSYYAYKIQNDGSLQFEDFQQITTYMSDELNGSILMGGQFTYKTDDTAEYSSVIKDAQSWLTEVGGYGEEKFPITIKPLTEYTITMDDYLELGEPVLMSVVSPFAQVLTGRVLSFTYQVQDYEAINVNIENVYSAFSFFGNNFVSGDAIQFPFEVKDINYGEVIHCEGEGVNIQALGMPAGLPEMPGAFQGNTDITKVIITEGIEVIGASTFSGCTNLSSISIPSSITMIEEYAFEGCKLTFNEKDNGNYLGNAENPYVVLYSLKEDVDKSTMTNFTIDKNCKIIYDDVFSNCTNLQEISLPTNLTSIGDGAFENCSTLTSLTIPASVKEVGENAFSGCNNIANVYYQGTVDQWLDITFESALFQDKNSNWYVNGQLVKELTLDSNVQANAFYGVKSLKKVIIEEGVTSIENYAFRECTNLESITIPKSVFFIGSAICGGCNLTEVIYNGTIEDWMKIEFHVSPPYTYANLFASGAGLYIDNQLVTELTLTGYVSRGAFYDYSHLEKVTITENAIIGEEVFCGSGVAEVVIQEGVTSIPDNIFRNCDNLTSITIPASVTTIGEYAFQDCTNLQTVDFGDNSQLQTIGYAAFRDCTNLTSITIPEGVTSIGDYAFSGTNLQTITFEDGSQLQSIDNLIPSSIQHIIFEGNSSLTSIGYQAFSDCYSLQTVDFGDNSQLQTIGNQAFDGCTNLQSVDFGENSKLQTIGEYAFSSCANLTSITIPEGVTSIGQRAFSGCTNLTSITIPANVTEIGNQAFSGCTNLTSITIPASVTSIGDDAFYNCTNLTSITIPASVTSIGEYAFYSCSSLQTVDFGDNSKLQTIGEYAFSGCSNLSSITIPANVTSISDSAFYNCYDLTSVTIESDDIYVAANGIDYNHAGYLLQKATTVRVLKTIDDGSNTYLSSTGGFTLDKTSDPTYNIYTK